MLEVPEIHALIIARHNECGIGLCGSCMSIVRWLMREHGILTTESWVADVLAPATDQQEKS